MIARIGTHDWTTDPQCRERSRSHQLAGTHTREHFAGQSRGHRLHSAGSNSGNTRSCLLQIMKPSLGVKSPAFSRPKPWRMASGWLWRRQRHPTVSLGTMLLSSLYALAARCGGFTHCSPRPLVKISTTSIARSRGPIRTRFWPRCPHILPRQTAAALSLRNKFYPRSETLCPVFHQPLPHPSPTGFVSFRVACRIN